MKSKLLAVIMALATGLQGQTITKISGLTEATSPATGDLFVTVDVSDISGGAAGTTKKITLGTLNTYLTSTLTFQPLDSDLTAIAALTTTSFGRGLLDDADASAGRTSLGLGTLATQSGTFSGTSSGTNSGDVSLGASVTDILDLTSQTISADDAAADKLLFWDDSAGKLTHLTLGSNLSITGTTLNATGGSSLGTAGTNDGAGTGGAAGTVSLDGGNASDPNNGGASGTITLDGGNANGSDAGGTGGTITMTGIAAHNAGNLTTSGGSGGDGGAINTAGGNDGEGGSLLTNNGGGTLNTTGTGSLGLGVLGTRTTLTGEATGDRTAKFPSNSSSGYIPLVASTTGIISLAGSEVTGTLPVAKGGTGITALGSGVATALGNAVNGASGLLTYSLLSTANTWMAAQAIAATAAQNVPLCKIASATMPSNNDPRYAYLQIGGSEFSGTGHALIGFGYVSSTRAPAYVGFAMTSTIGNTYGDLIFGTRSVTTDTTPTTRLTITSDGVIQIASGSALAWSTDLLLYRDTAAVVQQGSDANGAAVHQAYKSHDGITGTNIAGANLTTAGGLSTGTGRGGDRIEKTAESGSSGTTATGYTTREYHSAKWVDLTESTATTVCNVAVASGKYSGLVMVCTISADDATDYQTITSTVNVGAVNKAGTVTATLTQVDGTTAASSGTLTVTFTAVASGNTVDIKANAVSSLTQTTLRAKWSIVSLNTNSTDTSAVAGSVVTPQ